MKYDQCTTNHGAGGRPAPVLYRLADLARAWHEDAVAAHDARRQGKPRGPVTGFSLLDRKLGSFLVPGVHVLHGSPGAGKTAFCLQVAAECGFPALYVTCEMAPLELLRRITARVTQTFLDDLRSGTLTPEDSDAKLMTAIDAVPNLALVDAAPGIRGAGLPAGGSRGVTPRAETRHVLLVIDSAHSWAKTAALAPGSGFDGDEYTVLNSAPARTPADSRRRCPARCW